MALTRSQFQFARARSVGMNEVVPSLEGGPSFWQEVSDTFCLWEHSGVSVPGPWWNSPPSPGWPRSAFGTGLKFFGNFKSLSHLQRIRNFLLVSSCRGCSQEGKLLVSSIRLILTPGGNSYSSTLECLNQVPLRIPLSLWSF